MHDQRCTAPRPAACRVSMAQHSRYQLRRTRQPLRQHLCVGLHLCRGDPTAFLSPAEGGAARAPSAPLDAAAAVPAAAQLAEEREQPLKLLVAGGASIHH